LLFGGFVAVGGGTNRVAVGGTGVRLGVGVLVSMIMIETRVLVGERSSPGSGVVVGT
jgi:hypothetical protein